MPSKAEVNALIATRTALRDEAKARLETETVRLTEDLDVRERELAEATKLKRKSVRS